MNPGARTNGHRQILLADHTASLRRRHTSRFTSDNRLHVHGRILQRGQHQLARQAPCCRVARAELEDEGQACAVKVGMERYT